MQDILQNFHFIRPFWLLAIIPCAILVGLLFRHNRSSEAWHQLIDAKLLNHLLDSTLTRQQRYPLIALALAWIVACIALAGPTWEKIAVPVKKDESALVIVWDLSPSMRAQDIKPSRVVRSRLKLLDLLKARKEGLTGLIAYAGESHIVTPLTDDVRTISSLLPGLHPDVMPSAGSNPEMALEQAHQLLADSGITRGDIVFVTDGIASDAISSLDNTAARANHRISVWGMGTREGAPIPLRNGGFARNDAGEIVVARLDDVRLSDAAIAMRGIYIPFSNDESDLEQVLSLGMQLNLDQELNDELESKREFDQWLDHGPLIALMLLPFAAFAFRRGWLLAIIFAPLLYTPPAKSKCMDRFVENRRSASSRNT